MYSTPLSLIYSHKNHCFHCTVEETKICVRLEFRCKECMNGCEVFKYQLVNRSKIKVIKLGLVFQWKATAVVVFVDQCLYDEWIAASSLSALWCTLISFCLYFKVCISTQKIFEERDGSPHIWEFLNRLCVYYKMLDNLLWPFYIKLLLFWNCYCSVL